MDFASLIGIIIGCTAVVVAMTLKGASPSVLLNPAAIIIILVGTVAAIMNAFPMRELKRIPSLFKTLFTDQRAYEPAELIQLIVEMASQARREGLLSLESHIEDLKDPFIKKGLQLVIDGQDEEFVREFLETELETIEERHASGALVFSQAGAYAPTLGVLGAVIGLIGALGHMEDTGALGAAIAAAFVATLYGIFTGYVLWHPFANKLRRKSAEEILMRTMIMEGILSIQQGSNPITIKEKMLVFLSPAERAELLAGEIDDA
jgi:chemotaxis protein MotA